MKDSHIRNKEYKESFEGTYASSKQIWYTYLEGMQRFQLWYIMVVCNVMYRVPLSKPGPCSKSQFILIFAYPFFQDILHILILFSILLSDLST